MTSLYAKTGYLVVEGIGGPMMELDTLHCSHCGGCYVKNPTRTRAREYCKTCDQYICDGCHAATQQAGYVHRTFEDLAQLLQSGRYTLAGSACAPLLIPV